MNICINYNDPSWSALVEGLRDKLGINAEWEAKRDFYEHGGIIRTPKEVLEKLAEDDTFGPYTHLLEGSTPQSASDIRKLDVADFKRAVKLNTKQVSNLQKALISKRVGQFNKKNGTSYYIKYKQVGQADLYTWEILEKGKPAIYNIDPAVSPLAMEISGYEPSLNLADQNNARATEITRKLADRLAEQVNTPYRIVSEQEAKDLHAELGKELPTGAKAFYIGDTVYFLENNLNTKNALHEFSHPLVRAIFLNNRALFDKQYSAILSSPEGADIAQYVRDNYGLEETDPLFKEEIVVRALTEAALRKQQKIAQSSGFKKAIDNILYGIKQLLRKLFGQKVDVAKLDVDTTLDQLADMLVKGQQFKIDTELVNQDEAVAYLKDQQKYIRELSQSPYKKEMQDLTNKFFTAVQYGVKHAQDVKDYDALLDFVANEFKSGEVDQMRKNLESL